VIEVVAAIFVLVCLGLIWTLYSVITDKPTHEDKLDERRSTVLSDQLAHANALLTELLIIDSLMPTLPTDYKIKLTKYLGGTKQ
jgi:hypothetical protein